MTQTYKSFIWPIPAYLITNVQSFKILVQGKRENDYWMGKSRIW